MLLVCVLLTSSLLGAIGAVDTGFFSAHKDSDRWILSFSWLHLSGGTSTPESATNRPPNDGCCDKKVVGGEVYLRADVADNIDMTDCIEGCAYRWKHDQAYHNSFLRKRTALADDTLDQVFCFQSGNLSSSCLGQLFAFPTTISNQRKIISWKMANFTWISEVWGTCEEHIWYPCPPCSYPLCPCPPCPRNGRGCMA